MLVVLKERARPVSNLRLVPAHAHERKAGLHVRARHDGVQRAAAGHLSGRNLPAAAAPARAQSRSAAARDQAV
jgi:hypothetical protein